MKILFCTPVVIKQELGAPRVLLGVAQGLERLGWECRVVGPDEIRQHVGQPNDGAFDYIKALHTYLRDVACEYDVVDYAYDKLPFPRGDFSKKTLFVARSVLLDHHFVNLRIPEVILPRQRLKRWLTGAGRREQVAFRHVLETARVTMENADLVNVANEDDRAALADSGVSPGKIVVIPYGLSDEEFQTLATVNQQPSSVPRLCFLGTFDHRKGGADLPRLFAQISAQVPACQFRLLGTAGLHRTADRVKSFFPGSLREKLEVVPHFRRDELAGLLEGCSVGVFPSYVEGFGFAVLEMMAAGLPVVAYRSPGPTMMLSDDFLVPRGDVSAMTARVASWLTNNPVRFQEAGWCRHRARDFSWNIVGSLTDNLYRRVTA